MDAEDSVRHRLFKLNSSEFRRSSSVGIFGLRGVFNSSGISATVSPPTTFTKLKPRTHLTVGIIIQSDEEISSEIIMCVIV